MCVMVEINRLLSKKFGMGSCVNGGDEGFCSVLDEHCGGDLWENILHLALWYLSRLLLAYSLCRRLLLSASSDVSLVPHVSSQRFMTCGIHIRGKLISSCVMIDNTNPAALIAP